MVSLLLSKVVHDGDNQNLKICEMKVLNNIATCTLCWVKSFLTKTGVDQARGQLLKENISVTYPLEGLLGVSRFGRGNWSDKQHTKNSHALFVWAMQSALMLCKSYWLQVGTNI